MNTKKSLVASPILLLMASPVLAILAILVPLSSRAKADNTDVAHAWLVAWNSHDPDKVVALYTEDAFLEDVTLGAVSRGSAEIRAFAVSSFAALPDAQFDLVRSNVKDGHGTIEWVLRGTDTGAFGGTGKPYSVRGVSVIGVHGTRLARDTVYWDLATVLREIGLL
jgi:steroid delta-isomerase-like uncharacterized protein